MATILVGVVFSNHMPYVIRLKTMLIGKPINTMPNKNIKLIANGYVIKYDIIHFGLSDSRCDAGRSP